MSFPYKHVLLIGATSGIGKAMGDKLVASGVHVTAAGRRKDRLEAFVSAHGSSKASYVTVDIEDIANLPSFAESTLKKYPTIDAVFLNAGIQRHYNFADPASVNLKQFQQEMTVNFTSFVTLTHAFLPHLLAAKKPTSLIYTGAHIALVPAATMSAYSASKAALDSFIYCIREQLRETNVSLVNISPPLVQTELHDHEMGPEVGRKMGIPVEQFVNDAWEELNQGKKNIIIGSIGGSSKEQFMEIVEKRDAAYERLCTLLRTLMKK